MKYSKTFNRIEYMRTVSAVWDIWFTTKPKIDYHDFKLLFFVGSNKQDVAMKGYIQHLQELIQKRVYENNKPR